jgi:hypothetical protein
MRLYVCSRGAAGLTSQPVYRTARRSLLNLVGRQHIPAALARLFLDTALFSRRGASPGLGFNGALPPLSGLILSYICELNRDARDNDPDDDVVQSDAKNIAYEAMIRTCYPRFLPRPTALKTIGGDAFQSRLRYLEQRLQILCASDSNKLEIGFSLDCVAYYLASLQLVEIARDRQFWSELFARADEAARGTNVPVVGFLRAIDDACYHRLAEPGLPSDETNVLAFVRTEIAQRFIEWPKIMTRRCL